MNNKKIELKIGEFSKLNRITVKTLRHYEEIGLLRPGRVDEWTGYRYYDVGQMQLLNRIIRLKRLGFSLEEIRDMLDEQQENPTPEQIAAKLTACRAEMETLHWRIRALEELEKEPQKRQNMEETFIKTLPAITVASHRRVIGTYAELSDLCPNIIGPEMARLGCVCSEPGYCYTIDHNKEYREKDIDIEYCEAVTERKADSQLIRFKNVDAVPTAACIYHRGNYDTIPRTVARLFADIEQKGYTITGHPRFCYIDGPWNKESEELWLSEIQVPVVL